MFRRARTTRRLQFTGLLRALVLVTGVAPIATQPLAAAERPVHRLALEPPSPRAPRVPRVARRHGVVPAMASAHATPWVKTPPASDSGATATPTYLEDVLRARANVLARWRERIAKPLSVWIQPRALGSLLVPADSLVRGAFAAWEASGIPVRFIFVSDSADAEVHVTWLDRFARPVSGITNWGVDRSHWIVEADIKLAIHQHSGVALDSWATRAIALHEIGHLVGLDHTSDTTSIMAPLVRVSRLSASDIATVRALYSSPPGRQPQPVRAARSRARPATGEPR